MVVGPFFVFAQDDVTPPTEMGPSVETIKMWINSPVILFLLMLVGSTISMVRQWGTGQMDGSSVTFWSYTKHLPELVTTFFSNTIAFALLIQNDALNFIAAVSIGYVLNDLSDLNPKGTRSSSMTTPPGDKP